MSLQQKRGGEGGESRGVAADSTHSSACDAASPPVRSTLRLLEQKGLMSSDQRATRCIIELSNAIEPFLQTGSSNGDAESSQFVRGKYHPQPSIGLVRSQGPDKGWGLNASSSPEGVSGITLVLTEAEQANIHAALNRALVHIARLEEGSIAYSPPPQPSVSAGPSANISIADGADIPKWKIVQSENDQLHQHIGGLERQLGHLRAEREKMSAANKVVAAQQSRDNSSLRTHLVQARKESESSKCALREKEASLQAALAKLGLSQDEGKRLKHQCQLLDCASAHTRIQTRLSLTSQSAVTASALNALGGERDLFGTGSALSVANSFDVTGGSLPLEGSESLRALNAGPFFVGGTTSGALSPSPSSELEAKKHEQLKYGLDATLGLQATVDALRQELHKERNGRTREKAAMSVTVEEAVARAVFSEAVLGDIQTQLARERERRELAESERDLTSAEQQLMVVTMGQKEGRVRELTYEIDLQKQRTVRVEDEMEEMAASALKEKSFLFSRTADLTNCVSLMRMGIVEAQGELAVQTALSGDTAFKASRESDRIAGRLDTLVAEYEELWSHSQQQNSYLRSSGDVINTLTQKMTEEANPVNETKGLQGRLEKEHREEMGRREEQFQQQMEAVTKEYLESIEQKEGLIAELRGLFDESESQLSEQRKMAIEQQQQVGELQAEFMRDSEETSSQIEMMSTRLLAMSEENASLKGRSADRSDDYSSGGGGSALEGGAEEDRAAYGIPGGSGDAGDQISYDAAVRRIRHGKQPPIAPKAVVIDTSYLSGASSSASRRSSVGGIIPPVGGLSRHSASEVQPDGGVEGAAEEGIYENVNRASLIIQAMRVASTEVSVPVSGSVTPPSSAVSIDRHSLLYAVSALSDEMYAIQQQLVDSADKEASAKAARVRSSSNSSINSNDAYSSAPKSETERELLLAKMQIVALKGQLESVSSDAALGSNRQSSASSRASVQSESQRADRGRGEDIQMRQSRLSSSRASVVGSVHDAIKGGSARGRAYRGTDIEGEAGSADHAQSTSGTARGSTYEPNEGSRRKESAAGIEKSEGHTSIATSDIYARSGRSSWRVDGQVSALGSGSDEETDNSAAVVTRHTAARSVVQGPSAGERGDSGGRKGSTRDHQPISHLAGLEEVDTVLESESDRESRRGVEVVSWWGKIPPDSDYAEEGGARGRLRMPVRGIGSSSSSVRFLQREESPRAEGLRGDEEDVPSRRESSVGGSRRSLPGDERSGGDEISSGAVNSRRGSVRSATSASSAHDGTVDSARVESSRGEGEEDRRGDAQSTRESLGASQHDYYAELLAEQDKVKQLQRMLGGQARYLVSDTKSSEQFPSRGADDHSDSLRVSYELKLSAQGKTIRDQEEHLAARERKWRETEDIIVKIEKTVRDREERVIHLAGSQTMQGVLIERQKEKERNLVERIREQDQKLVVLESRYEELEDCSHGERVDLQAQVARMGKEISKLSLASGERRQSHRAERRASEREGEKQLQSISREKEELVAVCEERLKVMADSYHLHHTQASESYEQQVDSLTARLTEAEASLKKQRREHRNAALTEAAAVDERLQGALEELRKQLEGRYEQHSALVKTQHVAQVTHLEGQLRHLQGQLQSMEGGGYRPSLSMTNALGQPSDRTYGGGEREELEKRIRQAEARGIALSQQLQSMPCSLQVAQAEKRVTEARLQKTLAASDARLREQIYAAEAAKKELAAFLEISALERSKLHLKIEQLNKTIHQLTHHLHTLQSSDQAKRSAGEQRDALLAAEVGLELSTMAPAPWEASSVGDRGDRLNLSSSVGGVKGWGATPSDAAFAQSITAALPPYRCEPLVLPSFSLFPTPSQSLEITRGTDKPQRAPSPLNNTELEEEEEEEGAFEERVPYYKAAAVGPVSSTHRSLGVPLASPRSVTYAAPKSIPSRKAPVDATLHSDSEEEEEEEEEGGPYRAVLASKSPITPSGQSYSRTVVLPWQNPFPLPVYPDSRPKEGSDPRQSAVTVNQLKGVKGEAGSGSSSGIERVRERDIEREGERDIEREGESNDSTSQSSIPSVHSMLTADTVTVNADALEAREAPRRESRRYSAVDAEAFTEVSYTHKGRGRRASQSSKASADYNY